MSRSSHNKTGAAKQADLWIWNNEDCLKGNRNLVDLISNAEKIRKQKFNDAEQAANWATSRGKLRKILSKYTGTSAANLRFGTSDYGKPELIGHQLLGLDFNISHAWPFSALVVSTACRVGVDLEELQELSQDEMDWPLSQRERADLAKSPPTERVDAFFRYWTLKEAFIKAIGLGVSFPLHNFDISPISEPPSVLRINDHRESAKFWHLETRKLNPHIRWAIAAESMGAPLAINFCEMPEFKAE